MPAHSCSKQAGDLWSFVPAPLLGTLFAPAAKKPARRFRLEEVERDPVLRAKFSWLTRGISKGICQAFRIAASSSRGISAVIRPNVPISQR